MHLDPELIRRIALLMPALFISLAVHEYAHAWTATRLGDSTPGRQGRLTLSPLAHLDPVGSIVVPLVLLVMVPGGFFFGWAKPVEFNPANFEKKVRMRVGAALTAAAGPLSNLILALLAAVALRVAVTYGWAAYRGTPSQMMVDQFLNGMFFLNVLLAVFNLFPLPPLDGHYLLPRSMDGVTNWLRRYSIILFVVLFFLPLPKLGEPLGMFAIRPVQHALSNALEAIAFYGT